MRQIQLIFLVVIFAFLIAILEKAVTASFLQYEQHKADQMMQDEIVKAKRTIDAYEKSKANVDAVAESR